MAAGLCSQILLTRVRRMALVDQLAGRERLILGVTARRRTLH